MTITFRPFNTNVMYLVKLETIELLRWNAWTSGTSPGKPEILDPALDPDSRVESTYDRHANTITIQIKDFQTDDTGPGVCYEFQQSQNKSQRYCPNIIAPPPAVSSFNITGVGEDFVNVTWLQVEPLDSAPVEYSVEYRETGVILNGGWHQTDRLQHNSSITSLQTTVEGLSPGDSYQFRVVSSNRFGESYSHIEVAATMEAQKSTGSGIHPGAIAVMVIGILVTIGVIGCLTKRFNTWPWPQSDNRAQRDVEWDAERKKEEEEIPLQSPPAPDTVGNTPDVSSPTSKTPLLSATASPGTDSETDEDEIAGKVKVDGLGCDVDAEPHGNANQKDNLKTNPERSDAASAAIHNNKGTVNYFYGSYTKNEYHGDVHHHHGDEYNISDGGNLIKTSEGSGGGGRAEVPVRQPATRTNKEKNASPSPNAKVYGSDIGQFYATLRIVNVLFTSRDPNDPSNRDLVNMIKEKVNKLLRPRHRDLTMEVTDIREGSVKVTVLFRGVQKEMETIKGTVEKAVTRGNLADIGVDPYYFHTFEHRPKTPELSSGDQGQDNRQDIAPPDNNDEPQKNLLEEKLEEIFHIQSEGSANSTTKLLKVLKDVDDWALFRQCCDFIKQRINLPGLNKLTAQNLKTRKVKTVSRYNNIPPNYSAIQTTGNGDCLFNAVSLLLTGTEDHATLLRLGASVYAGLNAKNILEEYDADGMAESKENVEAFVHEYCKDTSLLKEKQQDPKEILKHAIMKEARLTAKIKEYSGNLQIRFLAGFVEHDILLHCEVKREGYDEVLLHSGLENAPMLEIMLVHFSEESTEPNHFVGLVKNDEEEPPVTSSYSNLMRMVKDCDLDKDEVIARTFVTVVAERLNVRTFQNFFKEGHSSRKALEEVVKLWVKEKGDDAICPELEQAFADAKHLRPAASDLPSDVEIDASKEDSEAEIAVQVSGPPADDGVENTAFNNLSQIGEEENKTAESQETSFSYDALLLYEENDPDIGQVKNIRKLLESWEVSLCDPYDHSQRDQMEVFEQSLKESRHAVVFLTQNVLKNIKENRKGQTSFRMSTFLCKLLDKHVKVGSQQLVPVRLAKGETPLILSNFQMLVPDTKGFERKLFKSLAKPGGLSDRQIQEKVKDIRGRCPLKEGENGTKLVEQLASKLDIPSEIVSNIHDEFGGFNAMLTEVLRCWRAQHGKDATEAVLDDAVQTLAAERSDSSTCPGSDQPTSTEGTSNSPPKGPEIYIGGGVKNLQDGHYNVMNVGGTRPSKKDHSKGTRQGKDGHRKPQNSGSSMGRLNIDGEVENMQRGDYNVMNILPQSGPDSTNNNMDAGSASMPASNTTRAVTEEDFQEIQEHVGWKWKDVARSLRLTPGQVDCVEHDHRDDPLDEKVYQMLLKWKQVKGESATLSALTQALTQEGLGDVAEILED
ncbi:RIPK1 [Branchiostoma lanceolatum]|uniref:RIPK1 protein n=1 Tax=Branchiostoma lanceolatum TaxID=7740 RepID=A0A8K0EGF3_BRALA|nr:RIPK1 [Branchiostoma lanceolatum]